MLYENNSPFHPMHPINVINTQAAVQAELITGIPQGSGTMAWAVVDQSESTAEQCKPNDTVGWIMLGIASLVLLTGIIAALREKFNSTIRLKVTLN